MEYHYRVGRIRDVHQRPRDIADVLVCRTRNDQPRIIAISQIVQIAPNLPEFGFRRTHRLTNCRPRIGLPESFEIIARGQELHRNDIAIGIHGFIRVTNAALPTSRSAGRGTLCAVLALRGLQRRHAERPVLLFLRSKPLANLAAKPRGGRRQLCRRRKPRDALPAPRIDARGKRARPIGDVKQDLRLRHAALLLAVAKNALVNGQHLRIERLQARRFATGLKPLYDAALIKICDGLLPNPRVGGGGARHHQGTDALSHRRRLARFRLHLDRPEEILHQLPDAAVHEPFFGHHDGRLHQRQNRFRRALRVGLAHELRQFGVPLIHRHLVAAKRVDDLLRRFGGIDARHQALRILRADALRLLRRLGFDLLQHRCRILPAGRGRGGSHCLLRGHARGDRAAHLPEQRSLVNAHQKSPALCAPAAALRPWIPRPMAVWKGETWGADDEVVVICPVGTPE